MRHRLPQRLEPGTTIAEVRGVHLSFGAAPILADVTLEVRTGEVLALVGPNGAGKSTLLGVLTGDHAPDRGDVLLDRQPLRHWSAAEQAMRRAVMMQQATISFPFTVGQIVAMGRSPWYGTERAADDERAIRESIGIADVGAFTDRVYSSLSGGERARVSLARALAQRCQLLLLDEPTAALDLHHQETVLQLARDRAAAGDAVVVVLHDLNLAAGYADQVAVLSRASLAAYGPPAPTLTAGLLTEVYRHQIEVWPHPHTTTPVILPAREYAE